MTRIRSRALPALAVLAVSILLIQVLAVIPSQSAEASGNFQKQAYYYAKLKFPWWKLVSYGSAEAEQQIQNINVCTDSNCTNVAVNQLIVVSQSKARYLVVKIDQYIKNVNICDGTAQCVNVGVNQIIMANSKSLFLIIELDQYIDQLNFCKEEAACANVGVNQVSIVIRGHILKLYITQIIKQLNVCSGNCINAAVDQAVIVNV
ncbi:MAG: hypothetical protein QXU32_10745 [Nitrososphaerales archaeon]